MARTVAVPDVPGVAEAIRSRDPVACATRVAALLASGADPTDVVRTAALESARHFRPGLPAPQALPALGAALDLAAKTEPKALPIAQACALAASEWRPERLAAPGHAIAGDELHLARSFLESVRAANVAEADAILTGLLREGDERRLAADALFEAAARDSAGQAQKLAFTVGCWRLARGLGWRSGADLLRPAVHILAATPQEFTEHGDVLREVGRARLDLELAARNTAPVDAAGRNLFLSALAAGPDRVVADLVAGLKRGRSPASYADLVAATAAERFLGRPEAGRVALRALATRFVVGSSRTSSHLLALLAAARDLAQVFDAHVPSPARITDPEGALRELGVAIEAREPENAAALAMGLADVVEAREVERVLARAAAVEDATADGGFRLVYASWAFELAAGKDRVESAIAYGSVAAMLARAHTPRTVAAALGL